MNTQHRIAVVVPAHNEARLLGRTLRGLPPWLKHIVVIDDGSTDETAHVARSHQRCDQRLVLLRHLQRQGVGAAIRSGYLWCRSHDVDAAVVMAGDGQMDPADLPALLAPVLRGEVDYAKGNRLGHPTCCSRMPTLRYLGTWILSWLTKLVSGYWHVFDSQSGFTVLGRRALDSLPLEDIYSGYGVPNDILVTLSIHEMRVVDVPIVPVYGVGERSKMNIPVVTVTLSALLLRLWMKRALHLCGKPWRKPDSRQLGVGTALQDSSSS